MKAIVLAGGKWTRLNSELENLPKVMRVGSYSTDDDSEIRGINTPEDLSFAEKILFQRMVEE